MNLLKNLGILLMFILPLFVQGQEAAENLTKPTFKNELGTDIISLIRLVSSRNESSTYQPIYQLTYKRHFNNNASFRFALGGDVRSVQGEDVDNNSADFNYRLGWEKNTKLASNWNFYYGIDFRHSIQNRTTESISNGLIRVNELRTNSIGLAPLIGIEYQINSRISLQTEAGFLSFIENRVAEVSFKKDGVFVGQIPTGDSQEIKTIGTTFSVPNFLVLSIKL